MLTFNKKKETFLNDFKNLKENINYYQNIKDEMGGASFYISNENVEEIAVIYYGGLNEITENHECYINIFIRDFNFKVMYINEIINEILNYIMHKELMDWIYIQLFFENAKLYSEMLSLEYILESKYHFSSINVKKEKLDLYKKQFDNNLRIRKATKADENAILECIIKAYFNGTLKNQYKSIGKEKFKENIKTYYYPFLNDSRISLVAEIDNEFCGHITYSVYPMGDKPTAFLIDVYIIEKFKELGVSSYLIKESEYICNKMGFERLCGNVSFAGDVHRTLKIYNSLISENWVVDGLVLYLENN
ncbi:MULTISPECIES: GNAT family N-acetyltransferase [unclassified Lysinibacillus]|uniref:GNAT family N-acetyltransferase n=1 Tax=unclassified Lysinibacillus TaxID=2636778 RepID=UPI003800D192